MLTRFSSRWFGPFAVVFVLLLANAAHAESESNPALPFLSPIFADHMVLQREKPNRFWGWTEPGQTVIVEIEGKSAQAKAAADGKWEAVIAVPPAGGPYIVKISGPKNVTLNAVLVGAVWVCGGQWNMGIPLSSSIGGDAAARSANQSDFRFCAVATRNAYA